MAQILQGDCLELLKSFQDGAFDAAITDPPYNIGGDKKAGLGWAFSKHITVKEKWDSFTQDEFFNFTLSWLTEVRRVVKPNGNILIFGSFHSVFVTAFILQQVLSLRINQEIIWAKSNPQPNITCRLLTQSSEQIIWCVNGPQNGPQKAKNWHFDYDAAKNINGGKQLRNVWEGSVTPVSEKGFGEHPSQKPEALLERLVTIFTESTAHVLDPFGGSGTTAVACKRLGRDCTIIDQEDKYINLTRKRLECTNNPLPI